MKKGLFIMNEHLFEKVYTPKVQQEISQYVDIMGEPLTTDNYQNQPDLLKEVEVIFSGWGAPVFNQSFLDKTPNLKAIFYAAGTMKTLLTDEVWRRGIKVTTANTANAIPVAEFTISEILFSLKNGWKLSRQLKQEKTYTNGVFQPMIGIYQSTVGIISLSQVGRKVVDLLHHFDIEVLAYDPFVGEEEASHLHVKLCSLEDIFKLSDVVSLHTPLLPSTKGMITGDHFRSMKENATFINTARGEIVRENEMIEVLQDRSDIMALLDVTFPEPPTEDSLLYTLPNVMLTPHIAGSAGSERARLGAFMLEEVKRYTAGEALQYEITEQLYKNMA
ncbi:hydroxyacid dehydrogenase [Bacillus timonensis]|uniref:hydroxyacid dehydrogenase n=1 Tax=Bacillus timonensis TaxID=1033734 RepID=UPI000288B1D6|nr:hydroxyacid dehydrogenase [Bacillus timonensis]